MTTIRRNITRAVALFVLLIGATTFVAIFLFMRTRMVQQFDLSLRTTAETIAGLVEIDHDRVQLDERDEVLTEYRRQARPSFFEIRDASGRSLLRSVRLLQPFQGLLPKAGQVAGTTLSDGRPSRIICLSVVPHTEVSDEHQAPVAVNAKPVLLFVTRDTLELDSTLRLMAITFAAAVVVLVGTVVMALPLLVKRGLGPLEELSEQARGLNPKKLTGRFSLDNGPAELLPIAQQLNASLDRIEAAFCRERRFAADAAHELRTPLAAIRTNAEVALKWSDPEQVQSSLADIVTASVRMQRLVERLLELARADVAEVNTQQEDADLVALLHQSIKRTAAHSSRKVAVNAPASVFVKTQPEMLGSMLDNLISNALTHSPPDSDVVATVSLKHDGGTVLAIENDAPHLASADLARMFEPLWTKSHDRSAGHSGLGLALVAEYARAIDIRVTSTLSPLNRLTLTVIFT